MRNFMWTGASCTLGVVFFVAGAFAGGGSFVSPGSLAAVHEDIKDCASCHGGDREVERKLCLKCHSTVQGQLESGSGFHARDGNARDACETCHSDHRGRDFTCMPDAQPKQFLHTETGFSLTPEHAGTACEKCHTEPGVWTGLERTCTSCHPAE